MRLPQVTRRLTRDEVMLARGTADAYALRLRFHDDATHRRYAPEGEVAAALFEAMETARCEAVGARAMPGTAGNIDAKIADEARRLGYAEITDPAGRRWRRRRGIWCGIWPPAGRCRRARRT